MKIYRKLVLDFDGNVLEEDSFEYHGPVAQCGGGGGKGAKPKVQKAPPVPEPTKTATGDTVADDAKKKAQRAAGLSGTDVTGGALSTAATTQKKSLLGQ